MSRNRRKEPRTRKRFLVRFGRPGAGLEQSGFTVNISPGGLFITTRKVELMNQDLIMVVKLPDEEVALQGNVAWQQVVPREIHNLVKNGFGVRLKQVPEAWNRFFIGDSYLAQAV